jgi:hypothetical protein
MVVCLGLAGTTSLLAHHSAVPIAKAQIRAAEEWWRLNRPKAPNAIREELERAASLISDRFPKLLVGNVQ